MFDENFELDLTGSSRLLLLNDVLGVDGSTNHLNEHVARHVAELDKNEGTEIILLADVRKVPSIDAGPRVVVEMTDVRYCL